MIGEVREVTFLVSDLRGFNALSSRLPPDDLIRILNHYFEHMLETIARYRGTVDELQGDGILAFFGAPLSADDDPERAVACAIEMQNQMPMINKNHQQRDVPELDMGIGINTGKVVVGNIGSERRSKYGAVGSAINTTYRIESYTTGGQILISGETYERVRSGVLVQGKVKVQFKGADHAVTLFDVSGIKGKYQVSLLSQPADPPIPLEQAIPIIAYPIEGKTVSTRGITGNIVRLGPTCAEVSLNGSVGPHADLKITITSQEASNFPEIYAKVVDLDQKAPLSELLARLEFTGLHRDVKDFFSEKRLKFP